MARDGAFPTININSGEGTVAGQGIFLSHCGTMTYNICAILPLLRRLILCCQKNSTIFLTKQEATMTSYSIADKILRRMRASRGASIFSAKDFLDLGTRAAVDQALARVARAGKVRRIGRGLYDVPRKGTIVGVRAPSLDSVAAAVARKSGARIAPTGAQAANMFGLTTQVPAQARYLTDRLGRTIDVGKQAIRFDHAAPRRLAGTAVSQAVIEAIRHVGPNHVARSDIQRIQRMLSPGDRRALQRNARYAPDWMRPILTDIVDDDSNRRDDSQASKPRRTAS
jgi:hypothetical protein